MFWPDGRWCSRPHAGHSFDTEATREPVSWVRGTNANLPRDIAVQWAQVVPDAFHCRASAISRRYAYILLESPVRPSIDAGRTGWSFRPLDMGTMQQAVRHLLGEHDFSSFRASACQALSPVKNLQRIDITRRGAYWRFEFEANAFLHHMIRNIMGCLVTVGQGKKPPEWMNRSSWRHVTAALLRPRFLPTASTSSGPRYEAQVGHAGSHACV
jgi:tRNA pseudouridine38-40 synthase